MENAVDDGVQESNACHADEKEQEQVGISVELKIRGLWIQDRPDQLAFGRAEAYNGEAHVRSTNPTRHKRRRARTPYPTPHT